MIPLYVYSPGQWALLFFFYCFCGWVWESCYVSAKQHHWVNRGFLHGPLLPIYGSGAIIILFVTLPVADNLWLVYILGLLAATALEYVVGAVMERLFKVRYWDYTKQPFNLHGYICLTSSIAWGFFSILLVRFVHPPIDRAAPQAAGAAGKSAGGYHHRCVPIRYRNLHQSGHRSAGGADKAHGGERRAAAAG